MKHVHSEMIKFFVDNLDVVVLFKAASGSCWTKLKSGRPAWGDDTKYFLCLPKHEKACIEWLNGETVYATSDLDNNTFEIDTFHEWSMDTVFLDDNFTTSLEKPKKTKKLKPFKAGATYKLRSKKAHLLQVTTTMTKRGYTVEKLIADGFTVDGEMLVINDIGGVSMKMVISNVLTLAAEHERDLFKRVDNK